jgi:hypothetical protein
MRRIVPCPENQRPASGSQKPTVAVLGHGAMGQRMARLLL